MNEIPWDNPVTIKPIGQVSSQFKSFSQIPNYREESTIIIREDLKEGLAGLEHFSHLHVIYHQAWRADWLKQAQWGDGTTLVLTRPVTGEPTCTGVFTTRSPGRPSAMGSCVVELLGVCANQLRVRGLDAMDGTPVLDIKIYLPQYDCFPQAIAPLHWCRKHDLLETSRMLHWDTMNVGLTLGMRAALRALNELDCVRQDALQAEVTGGNFFAQGIEGVSGCSVLDGTMQFQVSYASIGKWSFSLRRGNRQVSLQLHERLYSGADEVLRLPDETLFSKVECQG